MVISGLIATVHITNRNINSSGIAMLRIGYYCLTAKVILFMVRLTLVEQW
jgi:hypothetical protein